MQRVLAAIMLVILSPLLLLISLVQLFIFGKILFVQKRTGLRGKIFKLYKFQSLYSESREESREISRWGAFLRRMSIDELPQLYNILKGDMNFIGPRPLLPEYLPLYSDKHRHRHDIKPGLTGWAQVKGRNKLTWQEQFDLDVWYIQNQSLKLDLKILIFTLSRIFRSSDEEVMIREPFNGKN